MQVQKNNNVFYKTQIHMIIYSERNIPILNVTAYCIVFRCRVFGL